MGRPPALRSGAFAAVLNEGQEEGKRSRGRQQRVEVVRGTEPYHMVQAAAK